MNAPAAPARYRGEGAEPRTARVPSGALREHPGENLR